LLFYLIIFNIHILLPIMLFDCCNLDVSLDSYRASWW